MLDYMKNENKSIDNINIGMIGFGYIARGVFSLIQGQKEYLIQL